MIWYTHSKKFAQFLEKKNLLYILVHGSPWYQPWKTEEKDCYYYTHIIQHYRV